MIAVVKPSTMGRPRRTVPLGQADDSGPTIGAGEMKWAAWAVAAGLFFMVWRKAR